MTETTQDRIACVALRILEEEGPEAVSMRRVAKAVGITPMAIYHHYPSREALLQTITDREFAKLLDYILAAKPGTSAEAGLANLMEGYLDYALARPQVFDYVFSKPRPGARQFPRDFRARKSPTLTPVADAVAAAIRAGELRAGDHWEIALELWALAHGYITLYRAGRFHLSEKQFRLLYRRSVRRLFHGLAC